MNCKDTNGFKSPFSIIAHNVKGLFAHFTPDCRCWACDHCRPKLIEKHTKRANSLFLDTIWHASVPTEQWDSFYMRAKRFSPAVSYMRITLGKTCHIFADREVPGSNNHKPQEALNLAKSILCQIASGGTHVSYSVNWQPLPHEKPLHRWVRVALGVPRQVLESIAKVAGATIHESISATLMGGYSIPLAEVTAMIQPFDRKRPSIPKPNAADRPTPTADAANTAHLHPPHILVSV